MAMYGVMSDIFAVCCFIEDNLIVIEGHSFIFQLRCIRLQSLRLAFEDAPALESSKRRNTKLKTLKGVRVTML